MKNKRAAKTRNAIPSAQHHLPVAEIKNGTLVMKDGTLRAILMVSSINFSLKNEDEQNAIVANYVSFLNSLEYPLQIIIQSRQLNIKPYLEQLIKMEREQNNDLLRTQIADYRSFVAELVQLGHIMNKNFFVVIPYDPLSNKKRSFWSRFSEVVNPAITVRLKEERFLTRKRDLDMRVRIVESGLGSMGLEIARLDTQSLIELVYNTFNPDLALVEPLPALNQIQTESA